jgi:hypothetical protein
MEQLDRDILDWIAEHTGNPALTAQLRGATVKRRDYMKTGFFVYLHTSDEAEVVAAALRPVCPHIDSAELMDGAGCSLFLRNGRLHYLEIYARGGFFPETLGDYRLRSAD